MAQFLTTDGTSHYLEDIIKNASDKLVLVSPYLQMSEKLTERLQSAGKRRVKITLIYGKDELKPGERQKLDTVPNLSLHYYENLHAKCYYNEDQLLITSMNLHQFAEANNREMSILVRRDEDSDIYGEAVAEVEFILEHSEPKSKPGGLAAVGKAILSAAKTVTDNVAGAANGGYCIACKQPSELDRPYCSGCFAKWVEHGKRKARIQGYCHGCGKPDKVSIDYPLCRDCFKKERQ